MERNKELEPGDIHFETGSPTKKSALRGARPRRHRRKVRGAKVVLLSKDSRQIMNAAEAAGGIIFGERTSKQKRKGLMARWRKSSTPYWKKGMLAHSRRSSTHHSVSVVRMLDLLTDWLPQSNQNCTYRRGAGDWSQVDGRFRSNGVWIKAHGGY